MIVIGFGASDNYVMIGKRENDLFGRRRNDLFCVELLEY